MILSLWYGIRLFWSMHPVPSGLVLVKILYLDGAFYFVAITGKIFSSGLHYYQSTHHPDSYFSGQHHRVIIRAGTNELLECSKLAVAHCRLDSSPCNTPSVRYLFLHGAFIVIHSPRSPQVVLHSILSTRMILHLREAARMQILGDPCPHKLGELAEPWGGSFALSTLRFRGSLCQGEDL